MLFKLAGEVFTLEAEQLGLTIPVQRVADVGGLPPGEEECVQLATSHFAADSAAILIVTGGDKELHRRNAGVLEGNRDVAGGPRDATSSSAGRKVELVGIASRIAERVLHVRGNTHEHCHDNHPLKGG